VSASSDYLERLAYENGVSIDALEEYTNVVQELVDEAVGERPNLILLVLTNLITRTAQECPQGVDMALDTSVRLMDVFLDLADPDDDSADLLDDSDPDQEDDGPAEED